PRAGVLHGSRCHSSRCERNEPGSNEPMGSFCYSCAMPRVVPGQLELEAAHREPPPAARGRATKPGLPRLALPFAESAAMLGVSDEFFAEHVAHELHFVRR